ncbi:streptothricin acetyltransferase [Ligilactobacillus salitolerans]|uniref:Streptothricin acetyltransferase n=1 Tax=Ligilactobacillus salitolerans TaxID=1808352 RepID=A0A401IRC6_9LACO|nr:GNAT family N-acetyltransferase [Ligilactobacillus salitolerans]GBG94090.1 streptothricin acetyltransferase [Ligilactobacillus salitolerans]
MFQKGVGATLKVEIITASNQAALRVKNEPFPLVGKLDVVRLQNQWAYNIMFCPAAQVRWQTFPQEKYQLDEVVAQGFALGAFDGQKPVGLGIFVKQRSRFLYLADLKINGSYRGKGLGKQILTSSLLLAQKLGYGGIYTIAQDNNLNACLFYLNFGFEIGGLNTRTYDHSAQAGKSDVYFYFEF